LNSYYQPLNLAMQLVLSRVMSVKLYIRILCIQLCLGTDMNTQRMIKSTARARLVTGLPAASFGVRFLSGAGELLFCSKT